MNKTKLINHAKLSNIIPLFVEPYQPTKEQAGTYPLLPIPGRVQAKPKAKPTLIWAHCETVRIVQHRVFASISLGLLLGSAFVLALLFCIL